jgi:hypothetical protein
MRNRTLAIGAGYVNALQVSLRVADYITQHNDIIQISPVSGSANALKHG